MSVLILSDLHANLEALNAILADATRRFAPTQVIILGDMFTLGPNPSEVFDALIEMPVLAFVRGNHEDYVLNRLHLHDTPFLGTLPPGTELYSQMHSSIGWTCNELTEHRLLRLADWVRDSYTLQLEDTTHHFVHGNHRANHLSFTSPLIRDAFHFTGANCIWAGHTHFQTKEIFESGTYLNVGSSGMPIDGSRDACYGILDDEGTPHLLRVAYNWEETVQKLIDSANPFAARAAQNIQNAALSPVLR